MHRHLNTEDDVVDFTRFLRTLALPLTVSWRTGRDRSLDQNDARFAEVLTGIREFNTTLEAATISLTTEMATTRQAAIEAKNSRTTLTITIIATALSVIAIMLAIYAVGNQVVEMVTGVNSIQ